VAAPPLGFAVSVAVWFVSTDEMLAVNWALVAFAATVTEAGTATAALLLDRLTCTAPEDAALSFTVQISSADPLIAATLQ
jgi:hypothetical protein